LKVTSKATAVVLTLVFFAFKSEAQFYKDMSIGLNGGVYVYQGDLAPSRFGSFKTVTPGLSLFAFKPINSFLGARIHFSIAKLKGNESLYDEPDYRQQRNFAFTTPLKEISAQVVWNVLGKNYESYGFSPYVFTGGGAAFINVKKDYSRLNPAVFGDGSAVYAGLVADNAHGTPRVIASVPVGIGTEYSISDRFSVNIETSYRFIFTDYLDGFSQSASPKYHDHYHSTSAGIMYKFGKKAGGINCPVAMF
jgi:Domain of unknown function (DUF6089)